MTHPTTGSGKNWLTGLKFGLFFLGLAALAVAISLQLYPQISQNQKLHLERQLATVVTNIEHDNLLIDSVILHPNTKIYGISIHKTYLAVQHHTTPQARATGVVIEASTPQGYSGDIRLLLACTPEGKIMQVRVIKHAETPGLGDQIAFNPGWIDQFTHQIWSEDREGEWRIRADGGKFDGMSGATITSRAMVQVIALVMDWFHKNKKRLISENPAMKIHSAQSKSPKP